MTRLSHLECGKCSEQHDPAEIQTTCRSCGGPLMARYRTSDPPTLEEVLARPPGQHRLHELSPLSVGAAARTLGEGATALLAGHRLADALGLPGLMVKDESRNPTCSFKARGMALAIARAAELGVEAVCLPTAGNAGGAAAAYGALHGIDVHVYMPESTPAPIQAEIEALGAEVTRVSGTIADAGAALKEVAAERGWLSVATLREPYRVEGKKVMGYELLYDLGELPDAILYPTGGGTGLIGMWKAFDEMEALGWTGQQRPKMIAVQTEGCAPVVRAFQQGLSTMPTWEDPKPTAAFGLRVPGALGDFLMLRALRESRGTAVAVSEDALTRGASLIATKLGLQASPEGGALVAAAERLRDDGVLGEDDRIVLFNTGHALKYLQP